MTKQPSAEKVLLAAVFVDERRDVHLKSILLIKGNSMNPKSLVLAVLICVLSLTACGGQATVSPTATSVPTDIPAPTTTPLPTATLTPTPTNTPQPTKTPRPTYTAAPTQTPAPLPTLTLGKAQVVAAGGFSFQPVSGYDANVKNGNVNITDKNGRLIIALSGVTTFDGSQSAEEVMTQYMDAVAKAGSGELKQGTPYTITLDGVSGVAVDVTGTLFDKPLQGQSIIVMPGKSQFLYALAVSNTGANKQQWEIEGRRVFEALLDSIKFVKPAASTSTGTVKSACPVSTDKTFGYTKANPIKVGGGDFGGPPREREYLDTLRGPNGEELTYDRLGSLPFDSTILDIYEIKGLKQTATLYVDEYSYTDPVAPAGFTCASSFTLTPP